MRKITPIVLLSFFILAFASCTKEKSVETHGATPGSGTGGSGGGGGNNGGGNNGGGSSNGSELATWKFVNARQVYNQTIEASAMGVSTKTISSADFTSTDNAGTFKFDGTTATATDVAGELNASLKVSSYAAGTLVNSQTVPINGSLPASSFTATYKKIGTDSLYFADGPLIDISINGTGASGGVGYKLKWDGDKMTLTQTFDETTTEVVSGISAKIVEHTVTTITLQKQ